MVGENLRRYLKSILPPLLVNAIASKIYGRIRYQRFNGTWFEASSVCGGYSNERILTQVANATRQVLNGDAKYQRDGVIFHDNSVNWPLVASVYIAALANPKGVRVVDVGGGLGSSYHQHAHIISRTQEIHWDIVEQPNFCEFGRGESVLKDLSFFETLNSYLQEFSPQMAVLSSVLPYVERPHNMLAELAASGVSVIFIDRTPLIELEIDMLCIQRNPKSIVDSEYPLWLISRPNLLKDLAEYTLIQEIEVPGVLKVENFGRSSVFGGIFVRRELVPSIFGPRRTQDGFSRWVE